MIMSKCFLTVLMEYDCTVDLVCELYLNGVKELNSQPLLKYSKEAGVCVIGFWLWGFEVKKKKLMLKISPLKVIIAYCYCYDDL